VPQKHSLFGMETNSTFEHGHQKTAEDLVVYGSPLLIFPGMLGNLLCLVVLQFRFYRRTSFGFLLSALAAADIGVLLTVLLRIWLYHVADLDVRLSSRVACKVHVFFTYFFPQLSSWMIVLVSVERSLSVTCFQRFVTFPNAVIAWIITSVCIVFICIYPSIEYSLETLFLDLKTCLPHDNHEAFSSAFSWVDFVFVVLVPLAIIIVCNGFLVHRRLKSGRAMSTKTAMLLSVAMVFVLTTIPRSVYFLGLPWSDVEEDGQALFYDACILIYNFSNAVNFILYCVSSRRFREEIRTLLCCGREHHHELQEEDEEDQFVVT
jgi:hypothetical protein